MLPEAVSFILFPVAILVFASGFFPYKPFIPGLAKFNDNHTSRPSAVFDRVVFMVVDALRSDFVYGNNSGFEFTQELISNGAAVAFTAYAGSPTITMPRVKAITTGSVPSFLDVILNFAESDTSSTLANQDTWLSQLNAQPNGRLVMYGDDTWLKLFPGMFGRHDGTTSFFVSDFVEVDNNVTRHVPEELLKDDWNGMILHFLGLDHIGHKAGPKSPHMIPKQREMDAIVRQIYSAIESYEHLSSTLLVLCGDHGMNDGGNHGGTSPGETSPALTFISPKFRAFEDLKSISEEPVRDFQWYETVEQSDIAPTLADSDRLWLLRENVNQIIRILRETYPSYKFDTSIELDMRHKDSSTEVAYLEYQLQAIRHLLGQPPNPIQPPQENEKLLLNFLKDAQLVTSNAASNYNLTSLHVGLLIGQIAALCIALSSWREQVRDRKEWGSIAYFAFIAGGYHCLIFGSSFVEEEQQFWYWMLSGWIALLYFRQYSPGISPRYMNALLLAVLSKFMRRWNQTGQKYAGAPDIGTTFFREHPTVLWILALCTYTDIYQRLRATNPATNALHPSSLLYLPLTSFAFIYKVAFTAADAPELIRSTPFLRILVKGVQGLSLTLQARIVFFGILLGALYTVYLKLRPRTQNSASERKQGSYYFLIRWLFLSKLRSAANIGTIDIRSTFHSILTLLLLTQSRTTNVPLFAIFRIQQQILGGMDLSVTEITITSLLFQYASFFALGGSNAISSIDLSSAYNGIRDYNVFAVGVLTFIGNWAGPIWWVSATHQLLSTTPLGSRGQHKVHVAWMTLFAATSLVATMHACRLFKTHLFVWTVFSPKFLYIVAWTLGQHSIINLVFGEYLLRWLYN
ncbi:major facilitator super transporter protein [Myotisia sp. PD_48]|nr:major facilitator super transporter protein [Myotisia sp. PD_48]